MYHQQAFERSSSGMSKDVPSQVGIPCRSKVANPTPGPVVQESKRAKELLIKNDCILVAHGAPVLSTEFTIPTVITVEIFQQCHRTQ